MPQDLVCAPLTHDLDPPSIDAHPGTNHRGKPIATSANAGNFAATTLGLRTRRLATPAKLAAGSSRAINSKVASLMWLYLISSGR